MIKPPDDWYKTIWSLKIKDMSWVEDTSSQVDFIEEALELKGSERILDLACGYGRHSLELARRGYKVVGVDITPEFIEDAKKSAAKENLSAAFLCSDIRDIDYENCFDVLLNMADGAIGYLESDEENHKVFNVNAKALKPKGKLLISICSQEHALMHLPKKTWEIGEKSISLAQFDYDEQLKRMFYGGFNVPLGEITKSPKEIKAHSSIRLYSFKEITDILDELDIETQMCFGDYNTNVPHNHKHMQMVIISQKRG